MSLDDLDVKILTRLIHQARITWSELASHLGLSAPATADRVRRLEERGIIQGYGVQLDAIALGYDLTAFVAVTLAHPRDRDGFLAQVQAQPEIQECHHVTGEYDYLLKVRCQGTQGLERLISDGLKHIDGLKTYTTIVLSTVKATQSLPLAAD
ncbi:MAG: Lrp/AsnC family transcriptional regulator [Cyanobacteria bacterium]|nr:Lrp/AsnC family transcriptional regulator [Cyanobacteriota bacterium]